MDKLKAAEEYAPTNWIREMDHSVPLRNGFISGWDACESKLQAELKEQKEELELANAAMISLTAELTEHETTRRDLERQIEETNAMYVKQARVVTQLESENATLKENLKSTHSSWKALSAQLGDALYWKQELEAKVAKYEGLNK